MGPLLWISGALVGLVVGALAGLLGCAAGSLKGARAALSEPLGAVGAEIVDESQAAYALRYLIGISLALLGTAVCVVFLLDVVHEVMLRRFGSW